MLETSITSENVVTNLNSTNSNKIPDSENVSTFSNVANLQHLARFYISVNSTNLYVLVNLHALTDLEKFTN